MKYEEWEEICSKADEHLGEMVRSDPSMTTYERNTHYHCTRVIAKVLAAGFVELSQAIRSLSRD